MVDSHLGKFQAGHNCDCEVLHLSMESEYPGSDYGFGLGLDYTKAFDSTNASLAAVLTKFCDPSDGPRNSGQSSGNSTSSPGKGKGKLKGKSTGDHSGSGKGITRSFPGGTNGKGTTKATPKKDSPGTNGEEALLSALMRLVERSSKTQGTGSQGCCNGFTVWSMQLPKVRASPKSDELKRNRWLQRPWTKPNQTLLCLKDEAKAKAKVRGHFVKQRSTKQPWFPACPPTPRGLA